jgi:U3 small nucleolar RNA-associated protein 19
MPSEKPAKSSLPPKKKRKSDTYNKNDIPALEKSVSSALDEGTSLNAYADLNSLIALEKDPTVTHAVIFALYRVSVLIISKGRLSGGKDETEEAKTVRMWIISRMGEYVENLVGLLKDEEKSLRVCTQYSNL